MSDQNKPAASLQWGVKQSFRNYVAMTGGTTEVGGGAQTTEDGAFVFAAADGGLSLDADGRLQGRGGFLGEVKFQAHGGMLSVFLADPAIEVDDKGAALTAADTPKRDYRVEVARLDLGGRRHRGVRRDRHSRRAVDRGQPAARRPLCAAHGAGPGAAAAGLGPLRSSRRRPGPRLIRGRSCLTRQGAALRLGSRPSPG